MPDFTSKTIQPHIARVLLAAPGYEKGPADVREQLASELMLSDYDLFHIESANVPRWWHRALSAVNGDTKSPGLRQRGIIELDVKGKPKSWKLTEPSGLAWAREIVVLRAGEINGAVHGGLLAGGQQVGVDDNDHLPYQPDARVRKAVEDRAVELAKEKYAADYTIVTKGKPYDLECTHKTTGEIRHVEVKGFQCENPPLILLTPNEVKHVLDVGNTTDLVVVHDILVQDNGSQLLGTGGDIYRHNKPWTPNANEFPATQHKFVL